MPNVPLDIQRHGEVTVVTITTASLLDTHQLDDVSDELNRVVYDMGRCRLILDFTQVKYMSSYALSALLRLDGSVKQANGRLICCGVAKTLLESFRIANLDNQTRALPVTFLVDVVTGDTWILRRRASTNGSWDPVQIYR